MKSSQSAKRANSNAGGRARASTVNGLIPVAAALVPLAVMTWTVMETGLGYA